MKIMSRSWNKASFILKKLNSKRLLISEILMSFFRKIGPAEWFLVGRVDVASHRDLIINFWKWFMRWVLRKIEFFIGKHDSMEYVKSFLIKRCNLWKDVRFEREYKPRQKSFANNRRSFKIIDASSDQFFSIWNLWNGILGTYEAVWTNQIDGNILNPTLIKIRNKYVIKFQSMLNLI